MALINARSISRHSTVFDAKTSNLIKHKHCQYAYNLITHPPKEPKGDLLRRSLMSEIDFLISKLNTTFFLTEKFIKDCHLPKTLNYDFT